VHCYDTERQQWTEEVAAVHVDFLLGTVLSTLGNSEYDIDR
jgi:hypothetical protein